MTDFQDLDPNTRSYALVGQFLQAWSVMEDSLHTCIQTAFNLTPTMLHILCANLRLHDKLNIARTIVDISAMTPENDKAKYQKLLRSIGKYSPHRNMVAHDMFLPDEKGEGVKFLTVKAKGKFEMPNVVWTAKNFQEEGKIVDGFRGGLYELNEILKISPIKDEKYREAIARALLDWHPDSNWQPTSRSGGQGLLGPHFQPPQVLPDSGPTTQEKTSQTPSSPQTKEE